MLKPLLIFEDQKLVKSIRNKLPYLFQLAELESSRAGKTGMEVGSLRERIIIALLIYKFGGANVETDIPITEAEVDVRLYRRPVSIKTITGTGFSGVKLMWTVDPYKAREFRDGYEPNCDMLLVHIRWGDIGGFYYIPIEAQKKVFKDIGKKSYIKLPKPGTNPRGVEITSEALTRLVMSRGVKMIEIAWNRSEINYNPYKRWIDYWRDE